jgi:hypothetical protein
MSQIDLKKSYQHCSLFLHFCLHFWLAHCSVKMNGALLAQSFAWQWICSRSVLFALRRITFRPAINYEACGAPLARCALSAFAALADKLAAIAELEHGENKTTAAAPAAHQSCVSSFVANLLRLIFHPIYFSRQSCSETGEAHNNSVINTALSEMRLKKIRKNIAKMRGWRIFLFMV